MNDRRIVERLREWPLSEKLALEAADRIEALEAALRDVITDFNNEERELVWQSIARARAALTHWPQAAIDQEMIERTDDGWKPK